MGASNTLAHHGKCDEARKIARVLPGNKGEFNLALFRAYALFLD